MRDALVGRPQAGPARTHPLTRAELDHDQAAVHDAIATGPRAAQARVPLLDDQGRLLGPFGIMLRSPRIGGAVQQVGAALRTDPDLPARLRELAIMTVAAHTRSAFEWTSHEGAARDGGLTTTQLQALLDGATPPGLTDAEACTVEVTRALLTTHDVDDRLYRRTLDALGEPTLAALTWLVGYYTMLAGALAVFRPG